MNTVRLLGALVAFCCATSGAAACAEGSAQSGGEPAAWITTADGAQRLAPLTVGHWRPPGGESAPTLRVDPQTTYQSMAGFGASITDSTAWLIQRRMTARQRATLLRDLFSRTDGIGLSVTRLTIGASDFSRAHYSYSAPDDATRFDLRAVRRDVLPTVLAARRLNPGLTVIASPWSAPAWMKNSQSLVTGSLLPAHYEAFAQYLRDYVVGMGSKGVPIDALTIQNEPHFEPANYPGMRMTPRERAAFVGRHLGPLLEHDKLDVEILEWDHNWNEPDSPLAMLADPVAARYVDGIAWHCYGGDVSVQSQVHAAFPEKSTWMTECSGGEWDAQWGSSLAWMTRTLIIGATRNWARGVVLWNLALDEKSGPHLGGCGDCRGVVTINQRTGQVTRNVEYYVLAHASRFVHVDARRIGSDSSPGGLESVAFRNEDDGSIALIVLNGRDTPQDFAVQAGARVFDMRLSAGAVATVTWRDDTSVE
ncbi:MAG: glucosylceramidase [Alphaproteobacteria bacterium]|nr:MAG: glucosylceramidase [Caulobacteraceae bacterium]TPW08321.1 MAG: glucosylceramidase [Alphaproteobacteria bacterium]